MVKSIYIVLLSLNCGTYIFPVWKATYKDRDHRALCCLINQIPRRKRNSLNASDLIVR